MLVAPTRPPATRGASVPAPVLGWNARDAIADMDPRYALRLDNWFPDTAGVKIRKGHAEHASGIGSGAVETLWQHSTAGTRKMRAAGNSAIYDVTSSGAVGAAKKSSLTNTRFQWINFNNYVIAVNGDDTPIKDDGTTVDEIGDGAESAISGVTAANLIHLNEFKSRLFFVEKDTLSVWYLATNAIGGAASELDFSTLCSEGGYMMAMATWTRDGGDGVDDMAVFITSEGEVLIYAGTDPSAASTWAKVGTFYIGAPIGRRCFLSIGPDVVIMTVDGFVPLSLTLPTSRTQQQVALSDNIRDAVNEAARSHGSKFGWQPVHYPKGRMGVFNIPLTENTVAHQYVINTTTGAWCRFTGMNANCWGVFDDDLYFGGIDGKVYKADTGVDDDGSNIEADAEPAFNYFGSRGRMKQVTMVQPLIKSDGDLPLAMTMNVDFTQNIPDSFPTPTANAGAAWDDVQWDAAYWADEPRISTSWYAVTGYGYCFSPRFRVATNAQTVEWVGQNFMYIPTVGGFV
jgi:hypothetical protein